MNKNVQHKVRNASRSVLVLGLVGVIAAGCATAPTQEQLANLDYGPPLTADCEPLIKDWFQKHLLRPSSAVFWMGEPRKYWVKAEPLAGGQITAGYAIPVILQAKSAFGLTVYEDWLFVFRDNQIATQRTPQALAAQRVWFNDNLTCPLPGQDAWDLQHASHSEDARSAIVELPGKGQTVENWRELSTQQTFDRKYYPDAPEVFMNKLKAKMQARCPNVDWRVLQQDAHSILYEWSITNCPGNEDQHEVARILSGPYSTWRAALTSKVKDLPAQERDEWIKSLSEAKITVERQRS